MFTIICVNYIAILHFILTLVDSFFDWKSLEVFDKLFLSWPVLLIRMCYIRVRILAWLSQSRIACTFLRRMCWPWPSHTRAWWWWWWAAVCGCLWWGHAGALSRAVGLRLVPGRSPHPSGIRIFQFAKAFYSFIQIMQQTQFWLLLHCVSFCFCWIFVSTLMPYCIASIARAI